MSSFMKWRKYTSYLTTGGIAIIVGGSFIPETLGLQYLKGVLAEYRQEKEVESSKYIQDVKEKVLEDILLPAEEEVGVDLFVAYGNDPIQRGSLKLRTGAIIGMPSSFNYKTISDVISDKFVIGRSEVDWQTQTGQDLANALLLSEDANKFIMAREIYYSTNYQIWLEAIFRGGFIIMAYLTGYSINNGFQMQRRLKFWARGIVYSLITATYGFLYLTISDTYSCSRDNRADHKAAKLGENYARGGVEYYTKTLQRNQMLWKLLGSDGPSYYTPYGNVAATYRSPHVSLTTRRDNLIKYLKEYNDTSAK